jgi:outer membrane protein assembly factor BamB
MKGNEIWQHPLGPFNNVYGMGNSPVLAGKVLVLVVDQNTDSYIIALDKSSGEVAWKKDRPEAKSGHSTPILYQPVTGDLQVLVPGSFRLTAYSAANGEELWWVEGLSFEMKSTPVIWNDILFINGYASPMNQPENVVILPDFAKALEDFDSNGSNDFSREELPREPAYQMFDFVDLNADGVLDKSEWGFFKSAMASVNGMIAIRLGGKGDMTEQNTVWTYHERIPQLPSPLVYKDVLYMIDDRGFITTFKPETGEIIEKGRLKDGGNSFYSSPVGSDGKVYFISRDGKITVLPSGGSIDPLAQSELGEMCFGTPAISNGRIYLRTNETLYCFGEEQ